MSGAELKWPVNRVRDTYVEYMKKQEHDFVASSPVVPHEDPTLLFANAGMNQFKPIFLGQIDPKNPMSKLKRACNSQKCIRAGGKHNDLEDVGKDTYHHTFFEMLGNWSFGDYFKKEAIAWAWELLTVVYGLPTERIYATYFGGEPKEGLPADDEARQIWLQYLPQERVLPFGMKENFWEMGDVGPCGPCSEIHFDRIGNRDASSLVNADDATLIEIWNLVFMQFNREQGGTLKPLPAKHVDTGMGLERITSILQGVQSNYDTDCFQYIFDALHKSTGTRPYTGKVGADDVDGIDMAYRVVADHVRTMTFAIADGAAPGKDGRDNVLRRILRRGVRYGHQKLNAKPGFLSPLIRLVVDNMKGFFPEVEQNLDRVLEVVQDEEQSFEKTLDKGIEHFNKAAEQSKASMILSGEDVFMLYDTFGFPSDLTQLMAREKGFTVDMQKYEEVMKKKQEESNKKKSEVDVAMQLDTYATSDLQNKKVPPTDDSPKYVIAETQGAIQAIWNGKSFVEEIQHSESVIGLVLDRTNFYAEQGGQIFDMGILSKDSTTVFAVENVQSYAGYVLHMGRLKSGTFKVADTLQMAINLERRMPIMANHTFTHILNFSLRKSLSNSNIDQKGSLVDEEKLRFDFAYNKAMTLEEIAQTEKVCSDIIEQDLKISAKAVPLAEARSINGIRAVFGETYPDPVTVVSVGKLVDELLADPSNPDWVNYSVEFCGGTHMSSTGPAKHFVIVSESGIAKGVRRIIARTGAGVDEIRGNAEKFRLRIEAAKKLEGAALSSAISSLNEDIESTPLPAVQKPEFEKEIRALVSMNIGGKKDALQSALAVAEELVTQAKDKDTKFLIASFELGADKKGMSSVMQLLKDKLPEHAIMIFSKDPKSVFIKAHVSKALQGKLPAGTWAKQVASACGGKGGGKPEDAEASGIASKSEEAHKEALSMATSTLGA